MKFILIWLKKLDTYWKTNPNQKITNNQILKRLSKDEENWVTATSPKHLHHSRLLTHKALECSDPVHQLKNTTKLIASKLTQECNRCTRESSSLSMTLDKITKIQRNRHSPNFDFSLILWNVICQLACHCKSDSSIKAQEKLIRLSCSNTYLYKKSILLNFKSLWHTTNYKWCIFKTQT